MDHVHGSGIWSAIGRKRFGAASKGVAGITAHQIANKAGNATLDGVSSSLRKQTEKVLGKTISKKKKNHFDNIPLGII